ncbi:hypothetical protein [Methylophaga sp.]|uniref:hypothetical protein n=1 Tax=Methylophaga sp. TaxID=2024840 RepID=UPI003A8F6883
MNWSILKISRDPIWYFLGFGLGVICGFKAFDPNPSLAIDFIKTFTIMSGTLLGFLVTSFSILFAISDREFVRALKSDGKIQNLTNQVALTCAALIACLLLSVIYLVTISQYLPSLITGIVVFSLVMFARISYKYKQIFKFI